MFRSQRTPEAEAYRIKRLREALSDTVITDPLPWAEPVVPMYQEAQVADWRCVPTPELNKAGVGYFRPYNYLPAGWMFEQRVDGEWMRWMSLTPMELESHMPHIAAAWGTVVVAGLGMGFFLYNILRKPKVTRVVVLEKDANLLTLFNKAIRRNCWPHLDKFELWLGDALEFVPEHDVDFLFADIWPYFGDDTALAKTQAIQANVKARTVGFWGQEWDFVDWLRERDVPDIWKVNRALYRQFCQEVNLPLIEQDSVRYSLLAVSAVIAQVRISTAKAGSEIMKIEPNDYEKLTPMRKQA